MRPLTLQGAVLTTVVLAACASTDAQPIYPGTVVNTSPGLVQPAQTVVVRAQPERQVFGTPSAIPDPIRAPQSVVSQPVDTAAIYGYDDLGRQSMAEADTTKAEFNFEKALEVNPFDPVALNNLAVAKAERGQFHEAMAMLERAAKLAPDNAEVIANLARLRGYVQSYATAGVEPTGVNRAASGPLPPAPPALWGSASYEPAYGTTVPTTTYSTTYGTTYSSAPAVTPAAVDSDFYVSDACRRKPGKRGTVEVVCDPQK